MADETVARMERWADWVLSHGRTGTGFPKQSFMASIYSFQLDDGTKPRPGKVVKSPTALGKPTVSMKPQDEDEVADDILTTERAVCALYRGHRELWKVLVARYLGWVPRRRDRIVRDDTTGEPHIRREYLHRAEGETQNAYDERLARRLLIREAAFRNRLARAHLFIEGACYQGLSDI
jgi:hypothetical protein